MAENLSNDEVRRWYLEQVAVIEEMNRQWIERGVTARERAEAAWRIRRDARERARSMMTDPGEVELLRQRDLALYGHPDGPRFEQLVEKLQRAGLQSDTIYEAIITGAYRTDAEINRNLGF